MGRISFSDLGLPMLMRIGSAPDGAFMQRLSKAGIALIACLLLPGQLSASSPCNRVRELADTVMFTRQYMPMQMQSQMLAVGTPERVRIARLLIEEAYRWPRVPSDRWNVTADRFASIAQVECRRHHQTW